MAEDAGGDVRERAMAEPSQLTSITPGMTHSPGISHSGMIHSPEFPVTTHSTGTNVMPSSTLVSTVEAVEEFTTTTLQQYFLLLFTMSPQFQR